VLDEVDHFSINASALAAETMKFVITCYLFVAILGSIATDLHHAPFSTEEKRQHIRPHVSRPNCIDDIV